MSENSYRQITLTQGQIALVDADDYEILSQWRWFAHWDKSGHRFYAARLVTIGRKKQKYVSMHRFLLSFPALKVDHIDRNGLHNWRNNLRVATDPQNGVNRKLQINNGSGFRGVYYRKDSRKWGAFLKLDQVHVHLGLFPTAEAAAHARDGEALKRFGEFAVLNFPQEG